MHRTALLLVLSSFLPAAAAQSAPVPAAIPSAAEAGSSFSAEQLEQLVAPVALHPDALLAQILMAATYPLEVVEAARWVQKNPGLKDKALEEALQKQDWDPSVKALCSLPSVLQQMNENLDWTQDLGDAFLAQKEELMRTVQAMRKKALAAGNLKSSEQQKVSQDGDVVVIESTKTEVVYVPTYYPTVVYGSWYYPYYYYPPLYTPPPAGAVLFAFSVGVVWGGCWGGCNWHGHDIHIHHTTYNTFVKNTSLRGGPQNLPAEGTGSWKHDPAHRKGANYKNPQTAEKYGAAAGRTRVTRNEARGFERATPAKPDTRAGGALSGSRSPALDRSASQRGAGSRGGTQGGPRRP